MVNSSVQGPANVANFLSTYSRVTRFLHDRALMITYSLPSTHLNALTWDFSRVTDAKVILPLEFYRPSSVFVKISHSDDLT